VTTPILLLTEVSKSYRRGDEDVHALKNVRLGLAPGEAVGLVGPSGSGKTTLLMVAAGWERPDAGAVRWRDAEAPGAAGWNELSLIPQRLGLVDELTVAENVGLPMLLNGGATPDLDAKITRLLEALDLTGVARRRPPHTSLGEQQRTAVARALALEPALVLADEPTGHQDPRREVLVLQSLRRLADAGGTCLIATHNDTTIEFCHRVLFMHDGAVSREERRAPDSSAALWGRPRSRR
jgi:putative ABC transport system ATP-binding protein